jgi:hypothetical protein
MSQIANSNIPILCVILMDLVISFYPFTFEIQDSL